MRPLPLIVCCALASSGCIVETDAEVGSLEAVGGADVEAPMASPDMAPFEALDAESPDAGGPGAGGPDAESPDAESPEAESPDTPDAQQAPECEADDDCSPGEACLEGRCVPEEQARCDGLDNDGDGIVDEEAGGRPCAAGVGRCARDGQTRCVDGALECDAAPGAPVEETCNGLDDDCDGRLDEAFGIGEACSVGIGACEADGALICSADGAGVECGVEPLAPVSAERCGDAVDNDCDGVVDEYLGGLFVEQLGQPCEVGVGICARDGVVICDPDDLTQVSCDAAPSRPEPEDTLCNGLDEDCDGVADEGFALPCRACIRDGDCGAEETCLRGACAPR